MRNNSDKFNNGINYYTLHTNNNTVPKHLKQVMAEAHYLKQNSPRVIYGEVQFRSVFYYYYYSYLSPLSTVHSLFHTN